MPEAGLGGGAGGRGRRANLGWRAGLLWPWSGAAPTLPGDRGWGSGLRSLAPNFERPGWGLGPAWGCFGAGSPEAFPQA